MSYAGYIKFNNHVCHYAFLTGAAGMDLVFSPLDGEETVFSLEIPDSKGAQFDRLPLPATLVSERTATAVFQKAVGALIDRQGIPLKEPSSIKMFPVMASGQSVWVRHKPA